MDKTVRAQEVEAFCVEGPAATGKTEWLIRRGAMLAKDGVDPKNIVFFAATPEAAKQLHARVKQAFKTDRTPLVRTIFEHEMTLLSLPEAVARTKRTGRIMQRYEENIFLEDMKTSGVAPRRLAEMLKFFYRSCSNLEPMDYGWFYSDEEENTFVLLNQLLDYYGCYIRPLVGWTAYQFVKNNAAVFECMRFDHVLVDDFQLLSTASQQFSEMLARKSIAVAGDGLAKVSSFEEYPCFSGLEDFKDRHANTQCIHLEKSYLAEAVTQAISTLLADEVIAAPALTSASGHNGSYSLLETQRAEDEFSAIATLVEKLHEAGYASRDIAIAVPTHTWEKNVVKALAQHNITCSLLPTCTIGGDVRTLEHSFEGRLLSVLRLIVNKDDAMALRSWCGFGDYLANSALFTSLCQAEMHLRADTTEILRGAPSALFEQQRAQVLEALNKLRNILEAVENLRGRELLDTIAELLEPGRDVPRKLLHAMGHVTNDTDAAQLLTHIDNEVFLTKFTGEGVRVCAPEQLVGQQARCIICAGLSNGLIPERRYFDPTSVERDKRADLLAAEITRVYTAAGKASDELYISYFTEALLADAEKLKLKAERVRLREGTRVCGIHPSEAIRSLTGVRFNG